MDFTDKTVLVTGGGAGIGLATAQAFLDQGARVAILELDAQRADHAHELLGRTGADVLVVQGDAADAGTVRELAAQIERRFGRLDVLVNNVGDFLRIARPFEDYTDGEIASLYAANLGHVFTVTRAMLPLLRRGESGSIVSVSSIEAFRGIPYCSVYGAFKAAITGFTQSLALELAPARIRVNLIAPETTETPQVPVSQMVAAEHQHRIPSWIPLGRFGTPQDIADGILFLAGPRAAWITGTALHVNGGALAAAGWYRDPSGAWTNMPVIVGNGMNL
ncbi:SDR family NAD(P)-dependent oxidoreductase [Cupriavidus taiwanensis]|uniref:Short chain dehydrogenase n=1 Tax=Cupriavidus taiwanensis TaxID=164546 RepID=A0A375HGL0_9BURK|nr:SDR family NAD(P)-dependent oxidoreductase [Cupriavidus taiwanensis]SOY72301.1 Short chain dehydrogenase [Cupriavidus taiwanensis]SOY72389.1 Short chain dehydrogenase [Cupriavidus taiwanensis]SOY95958.1 Short chain dehydrogenase [Cupriavidus taiwanensis]SOZ30248.1 Short chain dehydrogenase [Cupriavidus taiwanensis]SOZ75081.1 Short chain dehydrogenase [Cupriavidus taiwanensis]